MTTADLNTRLDGIIRPIVQSLDLELVEVAFSGRGKNGLLRITIDRNVGVVVGDCERVSRLVGHALDVADPIPDGYRLEVSSPGLDRPLKTERDFTKYQGRLAKINTRVPVEGDRVWVGRLGSIEGGSVRLSVDDKGEIRIALEDIVRARLEPEWPGRTDSK